MLVGALSYHLYGSDIGKLFIRVVLKKRKLESFASFTKSLSSLSVLRI